MNQSNVATENRQNYIISYRRFNMVTALRRSHLGESVAVCRRSVAAAVRSQSAEDVWPHLGQLLGGGRRALVVRLRVAQQERDERHQAPLDRTTRTNAVRAVVRLSSLSDI